jgi:glutamate N-acetyltransferase/amino-acid N-acetyltransferase
MATMLAYVATDAAIPQKLLQQCLEQAVATSFNRITVDGDTSTNDACVLIATGQSELPEINNDSSASYQLVKEMVIEICEELAQKIVRDGEGATKFITINVCDGESEQECEAVAYTIAHSPLVKTAFFASDPNWGRILAAIGRADIEGLDISQIDINLDEVCIVKGGSCAEDYTEAAGQQVMDREEITVKVSLGRGSAAVRVWTCDLSHDYVRINAEYRT